MQSVNCIFQRGARVCEWCRWCLRKMSVWRYLFMGFAVTHKPCKYGLYMDMGNALLFRVISTFSHGIIVRGHHSPHNTHTHDAHTTYTTIRIDIISVRFYCWLFHPKTNSLDGLISMCIFKHLHVPVGYKVIFFHQSLALFCSLIFLLCLILSHLVCLPVLPGIERVSLLCFLSLCR